MRIMNAVKLAASEGAGDLVLRSGTVPMWRLPASGLGPMPEEREVHTGSIEQLAILLSGQITIGLEALRGNDMDFRAYVAGAAWRCNLSSCSPRDGAVADVTDRPDLHAARTRDLCLTLRRLSSRPPMPAALGLTEVLSR